MVSYSSFFESAHDPLHTSPITGESALSKKQILEYAFKNDLLMDDSVLRAISNNSDDEKLRMMVKKATATLSATGRFIDVKFEMKSGQTNSYSYHTLLHKWSNIDDSIGLLKLAGIKVVKSDISKLPPAAARRAVQAELRSVAEKLRRLVDVFEATARYFIHAQGPEEKTLNERFFQRQFSTQRKVGEVIQQSLARPARPAF